jgi:restriction endonuclease S subunit
MWSIVGLARLENDGVIQLGRGRVISKRDMQAFEGPYPVYSASKTGEGRFGTYGKYDFDEELITWSVDGGGRLFHRERHKFSITNVTGFLRILNPQVVTYRFLYYALTHLHSKIGFDWVKKAHPSVLRKEYTSIPLPPLAEQKRIVERLDKTFAEIDKAIATAEAKDGEVERLKAATLSAMLNRGSQSGESITEDEEDSVMWETVRLGDVCTVTTGKKDVNEGNPEGTYPFFTCAKDNTYSDTYSFDCEAILIAGNGAVGQTSYYEGKFEAYQRTYVLTEFTRILPKFLLFILQGRLIQSMSSMVLGNTIPYIKKGMLMDFSLPLPPLAEQKRIVERLDKAFAEIEIVDGKTQSCVENYSALKAAILKHELTPSEAA